MIGIDVIDIVETQKTTNWQRPRFLEKLFTLNEQQLIHDSKNPFIMVWQLWSIKEAAYKLYTQIQSCRFYNPKQFQCEINNVNLKVTYKDFKCFVNTRISSQYILSEAHIENREMASKCIKLLCNSYADQSQITKEALLISISNRFKVLKSKLKLVKSEFGIPLIYYNSKKLNIGVSISHHGHYGAYALSLS